MSPKPTQSPNRYRPCVGIVIFSRKGQVWIGKRNGEKGTHKWQFPQGGIDKGESPKEAAIRELWEETGLKPKDYEIVGQTDDWLYYDFPESYKAQKKVRKWAGQKQIWFAVRMTTKKNPFDLNAHPPKEFSKWKWSGLKKAPKLIVPFKRNVYEELVSTFSPYAKSKK